MIVVRVADATDAQVHALARCEQWVVSERWLGLVRRSDRVIADLQERAERWLPPYGTIDVRSNRYIPDGYVIGQEKGDLIVIDQYDTSEFSRRDLVGYKVQFYRSGE